MQAIWYFDFISPFAYLQLPRIHELAGHHAITPRPIVFAAILRHHGQLGPAEIPGKREFTYRMVQWLAESNGIEMRFPPSHPFNPLAALRLAVACGSSWEAIAAIYRHIWMHGHPGDDADSLAGVARELGVADAEAAIGAAAVKEELRANTEEAISVGVFGVPTLRIGDQLFWGNDATPMIEKALVDPEYFNQSEYQRIAQLPTSVDRPR
ncbi:MAG: 2-hydroxychromene-2-carboxylate isomerase [Dokdonella sp.]